MAVIFRNDEERNILEYVYKNFHMCHWFRGAGIVDYNPLTKEDKKTLVINCNFKPYLEMYNIMKILQPLNIQVYWREVDEKGNDKVKI